ncbi:MAG: hypothetical protein ACR2FM_05180 [Candidatus Saccharimonadales bacterium]
MNAPQNGIYVKVQVPISKELRDQVDEYARQQGFNSIQDFTRVIYRTVINDQLRFYLAPQSYKASKLDIQEKDFEQYKRNKMMVSIRKSLKEDPPT